MTEVISKPHGIVCEGNRVAEPILAGTTVKHGACFLSVGWGQFRAACLSHRRWQRVVEPYPTVTSGSDIARRVIRL